MCNEDNLKGLRYDGISIVYMQIFSCENFINSSIISKYVNKDDNAIDQQIFIYDPEHRPVERYKLKGFDFKVSLEDPYSVDVEGHMFVEMSLFFNRTVSLSYRMVIDGDLCKKTDLLTTDHIIELVSLILGAEHWCVDDEQTQTNINLEIRDVYVNNLFLDKDGSWIINGNPEILDKACSGGGNSFTEVFKRYKKFVLKFGNVTSLHDMNYAFVDIWESIKHYDSLFSELKEENIISHIFDEHKRELVGLMSLYPAEWPYRTLESFDDVCGYNVAIDTDDLILVNQNICLVFGTYGLRGGTESPTDWEEHLKERSHYHVSWPEYLLILEMILAKKHTIMYANDKLLDTVLDDAFVKPEKAIENNATLNLEITKLLMQLDAVKYSKFVSHKIMFDRTMARLSVEEDIDKLENMMDRIDNSLSNISDVRGVKQGTLLNIILGGISVASLFEIVFMDLNIPLFSSIGINSTRISAIIIWVTIFLIITGLLFLMVFVLKNKKQK